MPTERRYDLKDVSKEEHDILVSALMDKQSLYQMRLTEANLVGDELNAQSAELHLRNIESLLEKALDEFPVDI